MCFMFYMLIVFFKFHFFVLNLIHNFIVHHFFRLFYKKNEEK